MRKILLLLVLLFLPLSLNADTLYTFGGDYVPEWKIQVIYKEKFFENNVYYADTSFLGEGAEDISALRGMRHDFILRVGLPDNFSVNLDLQYVYQKLDLYNFNNMQSAAIFTEKYFDWWGALAGIRVPFWNNMPFGTVLYDAREEMNLIAGLFIKPGPGMFRYSAGLYAEKCLLPGKNYFGDVMADASAGMNIYSSEYQNIDFMLEAAYSLRLEDDGTSSVLYLVPQFYVEFFNDFSFIVGVEFYTAAFQIFINDFNNPRYLIKINYTANSDKRAVKPKEAVKQEVREKKWWQIDGVDDEMIPDTWKSMEEPAPAEESTSEK